MNNGDCLGAAVRRRDNRIGWLAYAAFLTVVFALIFATPASPAEVASHYGRGDGYWGRKTATGAIHRPGDMTTAHKTLPFGTKVKLTNVSNGKSVVVTVNNRGPFVGGRTWDVNSTVADLLGFNGIGRLVSEIMR